MWPPRNNLGKPKSYADGSGTRLIRRGEGGRAPNYARDYARGGGDYAEPQYGPPVLSWFNSGLNGQGRPLAGLGRSPAWRF